MVQSLAKDYEGRVNVRIYEVGIDTEYIDKYGAVTKSMLIINETRAVTKLSKSGIRKAFEEVLM